MPRPRPGYTRPSEVPCMVCGGMVAVAAVGRLPDGHPDCVRLAQDVQRVISSLEAAVEGRTLPELQRIRTKLWQARITSEANSIWNRVDNPAKRAKGAE